MRKLIVEVGRPARRLLYVLVSILIAASFTARTADAAGLAKTQIRDTVYRADGTPASGTLLISWPAFVTADGKAVAAGTLSAAIGTGGAISLELAANAGAAPQGTFYKVVLKLDDGTSSTEYWSVPAGGATTIAAIRTSIAPPAVAVQAATRQYVDQQLATKPNNTDVVHLTGDEFVAGVKTFATSPTVPAPVGDGQVANKAYVDQHAGTGGSVNGLDIAPKSVTAGSAAVTSTHTTVDAAGQDFQAVRFQGTALSGGINHDGGPKSNYMVVYETQEKRTIGQGIAHNVRQENLADGDGIAISGLVYGAGGQADGGGEGHEAGSFSFRQLDYVPYGTVASVSGSVLNYSAATWSGYIGQRPIINLSTAVTTGTAASIDGSAPPVVTVSGIDLAQFCPSSTAPCDLNGKLYYSLVSEDRMSLTGTTLKLVVPVRHISDSTHMTLDVVTAGSDRYWFSSNKTGSHRFYRGTMISTLLTSPGATGQMQAAQSLAGLFSPGDQWEQPVSYRVGGMAVRAYCNQVLSTPAIQPCMQMIIDATGGVKQDAFNISGKPNHGIYFTQQLGGAGLMFGGGPPPQAALWFADGGANQEAWITQDSMQDATGLVGFRNRNSNNPYLAIGTAEYGINNFVVFAKTGKVQANSFVPTSCSSGYLKYDGTCDTPTVAGGSGGLTNYVDGCATMICDGSSDDSAALTALIGAGKRIWIGKSASFASALTIAANNVTIECAPGVTLRRATASTNLFTVSGSDFTLRCGLATGNVNGKLVAVTGDRFTFERGTISGTGTNAAAGWIAITGGSGHRLNYNEVPSSGDNTFVLYAGTAAISDVQVIGNHITNTGGNAIKVQSETGKTVSRITVSHNQIKTGSVTGIVFTTANSGAFAYDSVIADNEVGMTAVASNELYGIYGCGRCTFTGNVGSDNGYALYGTVFGWHDSYYSTFANNTARLTGGGNSNGILMLDSGYNNVSGNTVSTSTPWYWANNGAAFGLAGSAASTDCSGNIIANNVFNVPASYAGSAIQIAVSQAGQHCDKTQIRGNKVIGTGTANGSAVGFSVANGTVNDTVIEGNYFYNVKYGISTAAGMTGTTAKSNHFDTVTTPYNLNATGKARVTDLDTAFTFATLPANVAAGSQVYVTDANATCGAGSSSGNTCFFNGSAWAH